MNSTKDIVRAVTAYNELPDTTFAIMIDGEWGCGKTYLWKNTILPIVGEDNALYISLFGLKSIADIESEIFKAMSFIGEGGGSFFKDLFDKASIDFPSDVRLGGVGFAVQYGMQKWKETKIKKSKKLFICFDDLERWTGDVSVCLAYINKLVEHDGTKCLVLGNASKLEDQNKQQFNHTKDKTIRFKYKLTHDPYDVFEIAFNVAFMPDEETKEMIYSTYKTNISRINSCLSESKCSNIRIVSSALSYLGRIVCENKKKFKLSETAFVDYLIALLSTVILVDMYRTNDEDKKLVLDHESNDALVVLEKMGLFSASSKGKSVLSESDKIAEGLVEKSFFGIGSVKRLGICSIVKNGFYRNEDFTDEFTEWRQTEDYEIYLDTFKVWYMEDEGANTIYRSTYKAVFEEKIITDPHTLLLLAGRMTYDIKRGVLEYDFDVLKNEFRELFRELYNKSRMTHINSVDDSWVSDRYEYCRDLYIEVKELNEKYNLGNEEPELSQFWINLKDNKDSMDDLLRKNRHLRIFEQYSCPEEIVDSLEELSNFQLFELTRWMGSRIQEGAVHDINSPRINAVVDAIEKIYANKYGIRAGHFKQIARILKNRNTAYEQESVK